MGIYFYPQMALSHDNDPVLTSLDGLQAISVFWAHYDSVQPPEDSPCEGKAWDGTLPSPLELEYSLAEINRQSPMEFAYDSVVGRYVRIYLLERRDEVERMLGLTQLYFPLFREALDRYRLPLELVYLPVVESALNPLAVSKSGAVGLWQFKFNTATMFNLHIDSFVDERVDPRKSTEAACLYLQYLYKLFDDWNLALAAYNAGPGTVQRALWRSGAKGFQNVAPFLPLAAVNYVAAFNAVAYVFTHTHNYCLRTIPPTIDFEAIDTVRVKKAVSFSVLSKWVGVPIELLHFLNPQYRQGYIPHPAQGTTQELILPRSVMKEYVTHELRILAQSHKTSETPFPQAEEELIRVEHRVVRGDYLHRLALQYGCTINDLRNWNTLQNNDIHPGDILEVWVTPARYAEVQKKQGMKKNNV